MEYLKVNCYGLDVEYEVFSEILEPSDPQQAEIAKEIRQLNEEISLNQEKIDKLDQKIDRFTNKADGLDYGIAVGCGVLTGLIDAFFVGEWDFGSAKASADRKVNEKVMKAGEKLSDRPYKGKNRFDYLIDKLEKKYHLPGDNAFQQKPGNNISYRSHRLDDLSHHPTIVGLITSIYRQFTGNATYHNRYGVSVPVKGIEVNKYGELQGKSKIAKFFCGIWNWMLTVIKTVANQRGHLLSDMATKSGIPGPILSLIKEISSIPVFKKTNINDELYKAFANGIGGKKTQLDLGIFNSLFEGASSKFDLRTEMAVASQLKKQAVPVIINEALVRSFYFFRRLYSELKEKKSLKAVDWKSTLPFRNRTILRMLTISMGTMEAVDLGDAAIRAAVKSGGSAPLFAKEFILRVNFVGVGRLVVAVAADVGMGVRRQIALNKRMYLTDKNLVLLDAKLEYTYSLMWSAAKETDEAMEETKETALMTLEYASRSWEAYGRAFNEIAEFAPMIEEKNPGLTDEIMDILGDE